MPPHDKTDKNDLCTQGRLRSAWASTQSDQHLHCPYEETLGPYLPIERTVKTLIRLGGCPCWSEFLLDAQSFLLVLLCSSSYFFNLVTRRDEKYFEFSFRFWCMSPELYFWLCWWMLPPSMDCCKYLVCILVLSSFHILVLSSFHILVLSSFHIMWFWHTIHKKTVL